MGIILVLLLYGGPISVRPLPLPVYVLGLVLITAHVWNAFAQVMTDASWYNPETPPAGGLLAFRPWIPLVVAAIEIGLIVSPARPDQERLPAGLVIPLLLAGSVVLLLPFTMAFEVILRAGREACEISMGEVRRNDSITVHSLVKNGAHALIRQVQADAGAGQETRSLADSMLMLAEEARQMMLGGGPPAETVALLWDCVLQTVPGDRRAGHVPRLRLAATCGCARPTTGWPAGSCPTWSPTPGRRGRGGWRSPSREEPPGARRRTGPRRTRPWVTVSVADDGPGMPAQAAGTRTSLRILDDHLHRFDGAVVAERREGGGTRVLARWKSSPW